MPRMFDIRNPLLAALATEATANVLQIEYVVELTLLSFFAGKGHDGRDRPNATLLEGLNGLSKTEMTKALNLALCGRALRAWYRLSGQDAMVRIQCTPDQSREDVLGSDVIGPDRKMVFREGPLLIVSLMVLLDELNRAPPKAQSALFSAMAERIVPLSTLDEAYTGQTIRRVGFHLIVGTQNPDYQEGTYPLPEAQLDRFLLRVRVPYLSNLEDLLLRDESPSADANAAATRRLEEVAALIEAIETVLGSSDLDAGFAGYCAGVVASLRGARRIERPRSIADEQRARALHQALLSARAEMIDGVRTEVRDKVRVSETIRRYIADYTYFTWSRAAVTELAPEIALRICDDDDFQRHVAGVRQGAMPRGGQALRDLAKVVRYAEATPQELAAGVEVRFRDVDRVAPYVLGHRMTLGSEAMMESSDGDGALPATRLSEFIVDKIREELRGRYPVDKEGR